MRHCAKRSSSIFDLGPLTPKMYSPKLLAIYNATLTRRHPWSRSRDGSSASGKSAIHWTSGPILVATAKKFCLGAEIYTPTGLCLLLLCIRALKFIDIRHRLTYIENYKLWRHDSMFSKLLLGRQFFDNPRIMTSWYTKPAVSANRI